MPRRSVARQRNLTTFELARLIAPNADALLELEHRFLAEEARLTEALGADDPPTFSTFVAWLVERAGRPPHRPRGRPEHPSAQQRRSQAQRRRREREAAAAGAVPAAQVLIPAA